MKFSNIHTFIVQSDDYNFDLFAITKCVNTSLFLFREQKEKKMDNLNSYMPLST